MLVGEREPILSHYLEDGRMQMMSGMKQRKLLTLITGAALAGPLFCPGLNSNLCRYHQRPLG